MRISSCVRRAAPDQHSRPRSAASTHAAEPAAAVGAVDSVNPDQLVLLVGSGAVVNSWEPIRRALADRFPWLRTSDNAYFAMARLVYLLRYAVGPRARRSHAGLDAAELQHRVVADIQGIRAAITRELQAAQASGELRVHAAFDHVLRAQVFSQACELTVVTTNWDETIDAHVREAYAVHRPDACPPRVHHLHGVLSDPSTLYLPTEVTDELYRDDRAEEHLSEQHELLLDSLRRAHRLVLYGLSLSPLDVELAIAVAIGCERAPLREISVVDHDCEAVAERLSLSLCRNDMPVVRCHKPCDVSPCD